MHAPWLRSCILVVGLLGLLVFGGALVASYTRPGFVERVARDLIRQQVEQRVHDKIAALDAPFLAGRAERLAKAHAEEVALAKRHLAEQLPARVAAVIAEMQDLSCACRNAVETGVREGLQGWMAGAAQAQARLVALIRTQYMAISGQLLREFRIFTGTNALVCAALLFAALRKPAAGVQLLPAAVVLVGAAALTAYLYLFNQDWLHALVFSDFVGLAYLGYLGTAFAFLCDVLFNRARITASMLSRLLDAVGSSVVVLPC